MKFQGLPLSFQTLLYEGDDSSDPRPDRVFELLPSQNRLLEGAHSVFDIKLLCFRQVNHRNLVK